MLYFIFFRQHSTVQHSTVQYYKGEYSSVQNNSIVLFCFVLFCFVLFCFACLVRQKDEITARRKIEEFEVIEVDRIFGTAAAAATGR